MQKREDGGKTASRGKGPSGALSAFISGGSRGEGRDSIPARNAALSSLISPFPQPKMEVGSPGDKYEQEADAAARKVMRMPEPSAGEGRQEEKLQPKPLAPSISRIIQSKAEEKKEPPGALQRKASDEEKDKIVQKQTEKEPELQAAAKEKEEPLMRKGEGGSGGPAPAGVESAIKSSKGGGDPLPAPVRNHMEPRFGNDFGDVRVHTGPEPAKMNEALNAQAFTHGNDIYFGAGKYRPHTSSGKSLIAHELTHTIQQTGGVSRKVQRAEETTGGNNQDESGGGSETGTRYTLESQDDLGDNSWLSGTTLVENETSALSIPHISLPQFKARNEDKFSDTLDIPPSRPETNQTTKWKDEVGDAVEEKIGNMTAEAEPLGGKTSDGTYMFKSERGETPFYFTGKEDELAEKAKIPFWDDEMRPASFHVDHIEEMQLGGNDQFQNYELLDGTANMSSGAKIAHEIRRRIQAAKGILEEKYPKLTLPDWNTIKRNYNVSFTGYAFEMGDISGEPGTFWKNEKVKNTEHLDLLEPMDGEEVREMGGESNPLIFTSPAGGAALELPAESELPVRNWLPRVDLKSYTINTERSRGSVGGHLRVDAYNTEQGRQRERGQEVGARYGTEGWEIKPIPGIYGGYINKESLSNGALASLQLPGMSPIQLNSIDIQPGIGIIARGKVLPNVPLIRDADIDILIRGAEIRLSKTFTLGEITVPPPFMLSNSNLSVFYSTEQGVGVEGQTDFEVRQVGEGHIGASQSEEGGFSLEGEFDFDSQLFDPAQVGVTYRDGQFGLSGEIGIPEGKVRGIKSADIAVEYSDEVLSADGEAELDVPGVQRGSLSVTYADDQFSLGGSFELADDIPGIRGGSIEATVTESAEEGYEVTATGEAQPDIPGVDTSLSITYENGILDLYGQAGYERGMLAGTLEVGATNRPVDENGEPAGEPQDTFRVYGGGELTLGLTPWLEATAGVRFLENGEIEVSGEIGLPDQVEVFEDKSIDQEIFEMPPLQIPLFAIPLGPTSIGVVAQIKGGADVYATIGPGTLEELSAGVTYNPDHEEDTVVEGTGRFVVPADAGLRLWARAGVGMSVGVASVTGNLELGGSLGLEGSAEAGVDVHWTPKTGIDLRAEGEVSVQPKFIFDVGLVLEASSLVASAEWRKNIARYEYGSDYRFGMRFPIHYQEGEPFDISYEDVEFETPDIDIPQMAEEIGKDIM